MKNRLTIALSLLLPLLVVLLMSCGGQDKTDFTLKSNKTEFNFSREGFSSNNSLEIKSNLKWRISVANGADWITLSDTVGENSEQIKITIEDNGVNLARSASLVLSSIDRLADPILIEINQKEIDSTLNVLNYMNDPILIKHCLNQFDLNNDKRVTPDEARRVESLDVRGLGIKSMKGLEFFTNLVYLNCSQNEIESIDISKNNRLRWFWCRENKLTALDLSKNVLVDNLDCSFNQLTQLDLSNNLALEKLWLSNNQIAEIDLSNNKELIELQISHNLVEELDLNANTQLRLLNFNSNQLKVIDLSQMERLEILQAASNKLTSLDVRYAPSLKRLNCSDNRLTEIDLRNNSWIEELVCNENNLNTIEISQTRNLFTLLCTQNRGVGKIYVWPEFNLINPSSEFKIVELDEQLKFEQRE